MALILLIDETFCCAVKRSKAQSEKLKAIVIKITGLILQQYFFLIFMKRSTFGEFC